MAISIPPMASACCIPNVETRTLANATKDEDESIYIDRKSTRLNSSYSQISYAVFCLKQKTRPSGQRLGHEDRERYLHLHRDGRPNWEQAVHGGGRRYSLQRQRNLDR